MKKGEKKVKEPKVKKEKDAPAVSVEDKLDAVLGGINVLAGAVNKLVEMQTKVPLVGAGAGALSADPDFSPKEVFDPKFEDPTYPQGYVPPAYKQIVDTLLSPEFGIRVQDFVDRTDFQLDIIVPDKYSSVPKEERTKGLQDIRSRMIPRALGVNGVREWCQLIRQNLSRHYTKEGVASPFQNITE